VAVPVTGRGFTGRNRLAQGMTYKARCRHQARRWQSRHPGHAQTDKTADLLRAMGRFVHSLGGLYITGEDVGTTVQRHGPYPAGDALRCRPPPRHGLQR